MANKMAEASIILVILMISIWSVADASWNSTGTICGNVMKTIVAIMAMNNVAPVSIVSAIFFASSLSFTRNSEKIGKKAAESALAIKKLNKISGIKKDALYASVASVVPK